MCSRTLGGWELQGHALSNEMQNTGTIVAACTHGSRMAVLGDQVRTNVHTFFAVSYIAFLYQLIVLDTELGTVFEPWCLDLMKRYFASIGVSFKDFDDSCVGAQSVGGILTHDVRRDGSRGTFHPNEQCFTAPAFIRMENALSSPINPNEWKLGLPQSSPFKTLLEFIFCSNVLPPQLMLPLASDQNLITAEELQAEEEQGVSECVQYHHVHEREPGMAFSSPSQHNIITTSGLENPPGANRCWLNALLISLVSLPGMSGWLSEWNYCHYLKHDIIILI